MSEIERGRSGAFNATGPKEPLGTGALLAACKDASGSDATFTWVDEKTLIAEGLT